MRSLRTNTLLRVFISNCVFFPMIKNNRAWETRYAYNFTCKHYLKNKALLKNNCATKEAGDLILLKCFLGKIAQIRSVKENTYEPWNLSHHLFVCNSAPLSSLNVSIFLFSMPPVSQKSWRIKRVWNKIQPVALASFSIRLPLWHNDTLNVVYDHTRAHTHSRNMLSWWCLHE